MELKANHIQGLNRYEFVHGKKPRGGEGWMFSEFVKVDWDKLDQIMHVPPQKTWTDAKRWAIAEANARGWKSIWLCT